jgi:hypothetical protein
MPSIAVDNCGNAAITYTQSSSGRFPEMRYTGRLATDAPNSMQSAVIAKTSAGFHDDFITEVPERWGDYSTTALDPADQSFWVANEYVATAAVAGDDSVWGTWIAKFTFGCTVGVGPTPTPTPTPTITPTPTPKDPNGDTDGDGIINSLDPDDDNDGCPDTNEIQTAAGSEMTGGRRNPHNPYDYFNPTNDGLIRIDDILAVVGRYFSSGDPTGPLNTIPPAPPAYHPKFNRAPLGPNVWNLTQGSGQVLLADILAVIKQYFHDCGSGIVKV